MSTQGNRISAATAVLDLGICPASVRAIENGPRNRRRAATKSAVAADVATVFTGTAADAATGDQIIVRDLVTSKGSTSVVPMNLNNDNLADLLSYNATTGRALYSIGADPPGSQVIVRDLNASPGWTSVVPLTLNADNLTDLLSQNKSTGRAVYSVTAEP
jgi:hypothetical protein